MTREALELSEHFEGAFRHLRDMRPTETSLCCDSVKRHEKSVVDVGRELVRPLPGVCVRSAVVLRTIMTPSEWRDRLNDESARNVTRALPA